MKSAPLYLLVMITMFGAVSCKNPGFKRTKSGLQYKIISDGKGDPVKKGGFLKMSMVVKVHDSLLNSTSESGMPAYVRVDSSRGDYSPAEIFPLLRDGDSVLVVLLADTLRRKYGQLPAFFRKNDKLTYGFKVTKVFTTEDAVMADRNVELEKQKQREIKVVEDYLAANKINAEKTDKGTYVVVQTPGDGPPVDSGKQVSVRYTLKLIPSGKVFESNMTPPSSEPMKFVIGQGRVVPGFDDGLRKFRKGGKGTLYLPAYLAYDQAKRPGTTPYENLIFDIEVVDVTDAPKTPPPPTMSMPGMPGMQMRPPQQGMPQRR